MKKIKLQKKFKNRVRLRHIEWLYRACDGTINF